WGGGIASGIKIIRRQSGDGSHVAEVRVGDVGLVHRRGEFGKPVAVAGVPAQRREQRQRADVARVLRKADLQPVDRLDGVVAAQRELRAEKRGGGLRRAGRLVVGGAEVLGGRRAVAALLLEDRQAQPRRRLGGRLLGPVLKQARGFVIVAAKPG